MASWKKKLEHASFLKQTLSGRAGPRNPGNPFVIGKSIAQQPELSGIKNGDARGNFIVGLCSGSGLGLTYEYDLDSLVVTMARA